MFGLSTKGYYRSFITKDVTKLSIYHISVHFVLFSLLVVKPTLEEDSISEVKDLLYSTSCSLISLLVIKVE